MANNRGHDLGQYPMVRLDKTLKNARSKGMYKMDRGERSQNPKIRGSTWRLDICEPQCCIAQWNANERGAERQQTRVCWESRLLGSLLCTRDELQCFELLLLFLENDSLTTSEAAHKQLYSLELYACLSGSSVNLAIHVKSAVGPWDCNRQPVAYL